MASRVESLDATGAGSGELGGGIPGGNPGGGGGGGNWKTFASRVGSKEGGAGGGKEPGAVKEVPMDFKTKEYDIIEEDMAPHTHPEIAEEQEMTKASSRRLQISLEHRSCFSTTHLPLISTSNAVQRIAAKLVPKASACALQMTATQ